VPVRPILLLGDPALHQTCAEVHLDELALASGWSKDLHDTTVDFRARHGFGRAIAAPQIGIMKRLIYFLIERPVVLINPRLHDFSEETIELWDDCMSFPDLLVKVRRHRRCVATFRNLEWGEDTWALEDNLSELLQHECDHLDGILATQRAIDGRSFALKSQRPRPR